MRNKYCGGGSATRALMESNPAPPSPSATQPIFAPISSEQAAAPPPSLGGFALGSRGSGSSLRASASAQVEAAAPMSAAEQWRAAVEADKQRGGGR